MEETRPTILFVCTGNAGRSQMSEALCRRALGDRARILSAGVDPWEDLHPVAARLMNERGIDMTGHHPKHVRTMAETTLDWVVTIGGPARDGTPHLSGNPRRIHWPVSDPADADETPEQEAVFRRTLAKIEEALQDLLGMVDSNPPARDLHLAPGISTCVVRPNRFDPAAHLPLIADAGFRCIELNCNCGSDDFPWDRPEQVRELARIADDTGVRIFSVHSEGHNIPPEGVFAQRRAIDLAKTFADLAAELGALVVPLHLGLSGAAGRERDERCLRVCLAELQEHVLPMPCRFGWENGAWGLTAEEHLQWLQELNPSAFGFVLDTGHCNLAGDLDTYFPGPGLALCDLHLNGNRGDGDSHMIPGQGSVCWQGFVD